jgi:cell division cycle 20-like protein 1 (cofactor of APC complex)
MGINGDVSGAAGLSAALKRPIEPNSAASTPRTSTPPPQSERLRLEPRQDSSRNSRLSSTRPELGRHSAFDADAVDIALRREMSRGNRDSTPGASPHRKRQRINGDRFIPTRSGQDLQASFSLLHEDGSPATPSRQKKRTPHGELHFQRSKSSKSLSYRPWY